MSNSAHPPESRRQADAALRHSWLHRFFLAGVMIKGINGLLQSAGGVALLVVDPQTIRDWSQYVADLVGPDDFAGHWLAHLGDRASTARYALAGYLLAHGAIKLFLVTALMRRWLWAYPVAIAVSGVIIALELWWLVFHFSLALPPLMVVDAVICVLIWREHKRLRAIASLPAIN